MATEYRGAHPETDAFVTNLINTDSATSAALRAAFASVRMMRPNGNTAVALGDSNTYLPGTGQVDAWFVQAAVRSRQRFQYRGIYATSGQTIQEASAAWLSTILALSPRPVACFILLGTNNTNRNNGTIFDLNGDSAAYLSIVQQLQAAGIMPIACLIPPNNNTGVPLIQTNIYQLNRRIRRYGDQYGFPVIDTFSPLVDATTGGYKSAYMLTSDGLGLHMNDVGRRIFAETVVAGASPLFPPAPLLTTKSAADPYNLIPSGQGLFQSETGWANFNDTANGTSSLVAPQASDNLAGQWQQISYQGTSASGFLVQHGTITLTSALDGHTIAFSGRIQASGVEAAAAAGGTPQILVRCDMRDTNSTSLGFMVGIYSWPVDCPDGTFYVEYTAPAGLIKLVPQFQVSGATASTPVVARVGELTIRDLTAMG